jgi:hypothetical protein
MSTTPDGAKRINPAGDIGSLMLEREASGRRNRRPDERAVS